MTYINVCQRMCVQTSMGEEVGLCSVHVYLLCLLRYMIVIML